MQEQLLHHYYQPLGPNRKLQQFYSSRNIPTLSDNLPNENQSKSDKSVYMFIQKKEDLKI